jgi:acetyl esterase
VGQAGGRDGQAEETGCGSTFGWGRVHHVSPSVPFINTSVNHPSAIAHSNDLPFISPSRCRPENEGHLCRTLCDTLSSVVISPDYAKAPQHPFPVALNQCYALIRWIADPDGLFQFLSTSGTPSIKTFLPNVDPTRIALSGGSSGGNLAAALVVKCMDGPSLPLDARIVGLGLLYAMIDVTVPFQEKLKDVPDKSKVLPRWLTRLFLDGYLDQLRIPANAEKLRNPYLSPALCSHEQLERFPKTIVVTAENDYLCKEGEIFADRLEKEAGFPIARDGNKKIGDGHGKLWRKTFKNVGHGFDIAPNLTKETQRIHGQAREEAWGMICEAFDQELSERKRWAKRDDNQRSSPESSMQ